MPEWIAETLKYVGPFGVFCLAVLYLLMRDRKNNQRAGINPGPSWQQDMKEGQDRINETLGRIERLLNKMWGRQSGTE